jgi:hypothetical protein
LMENGSAATGAVAAKNRLAIPKKADFIPRPVERLTKIACGQIRPGPPNCPIGLQANKRNPIPL